MKNTPGAIVIRISAAIVAAWLLALFVKTPSFPTPDKLLVFAFFVCLALGQAKELLKRFLPLVLLLLAYESFRGLVPLLNQNVHFMSMVSFDKMSGSLPTASLQRLLWRGTPQWYDFALYLVYMLHFVLPFGLGILLWRLRDKEYWRYAMAYISVSFAGFVTFLLYPAAPPWMASERGYIQPIARVSSFVWARLGIHDFPSVYNSISPNPVAAVPSLHAAYATIFALLVYSIFGKKWGLLAWIYPVLIYFGTVYMGEHYVFDELVGALYGLLAFLTAPVLVRSMSRMSVGLRQTFGGQKRLLIPEQPKL